MYDCVCQNNFEYLQLLKQYRKTDSGLVNGINKCDLDKTDGFTPLTKLVTSKHCNKKWLMLLLSFSKIDINQRCQNPKYIGKHALDLATNQEFADLIVQKL